MKRLVLGALAALAATGALASSHREAPAVTATPKVDATDFYIFNSYESGRAGYVTMVANYLPLQDPYGGPNYFALDPSALYEIKVDHDGDAIEDLTFTFRFSIERRDLALPIGPEGVSRRVAIPLIQAGAIGAGSEEALNVLESFTVNLRRGPGAAQPLRDAETGEARFRKPVDNIGNKTLADYETYASGFVHEVTVPGCERTGRVFAGQRKDPFVVNLGEIFDLVNIANPAGDPSAETDDLADKNVTSLVLELPADCLTSGSSPIVGAWTTASLPRFRAERPDAPRGGWSAGSAYTQVSRLSSPLVNEVVIGLKDKDRFNASQPRDDAQFLEYVTHPTLPALIELLFGPAVKAPTLFPRADLVAAFLIGVDGLNRTARPAEMLRLNTSIPSVPAAQQHRLGVLGGDLAGFPNGRRPGDDVVDIELRVAMGALLPAEVAPSGSLPFTDGAFLDASFVDSTFPYLRSPVPGSPRP